MLKKKNKKEKEKEKGKKRERKGKEKRKRVFHPATRGIKPPVKDIKSIKKYSSIQDTLLLLLHTFAITAAHPMKFKIPVRPPHVGGGKKHPVLRSLTTSLTRTQV